MSGWDDDHYEDVKPRPVGAWLWMSVALWAVIFGGAWALWAWLW